MKTYQFNLRSIYQTYIGVASYDIPAFCSADPTAMVFQEADTKIDMLMHHLLTQFSAQHSDCWPDEGKLGEILLALEVLVPNLAVPLPLLMLFVDPGLKIFVLGREPQMRGLMSSHLPNPTCMGAVRSRHCLTEFQAGYTVNDPCLIQTLS